MATLQLITIRDDTIKLDILIVWTRPYIKHQIDIKAFLLVWILTHIMTSKDNMILNTKLLYVLVIFFFNPTIMCSLIMSLPYLNMFSCLT